MKLSVDGAVARVVLDRPEVRNAQTPAMWRALAEFGTTLNGDVRVVVVSGEGPSFSAGIDLNLVTDGVFIALGTKPVAEIDETITAYQQGFSWLRNRQFVSIAAVQGHAIGAGFQLALACDLRVVTDDAKFCMREPALGLVPDLTGTQPLVDLVGYSRALEICATSRWVPADEARQLGLANIVVPAGELEATVADLTAALLAPPAGAVRETKALLQEAARRSFHDQMKAEREAQTRRLAELVGDGGHDEAV